MIRKIKKEVGCSFKENIQYMDQTLPVEKSFDIIRREMEIGGKESGDHNRRKGVCVLLH